MEFFTLLAAVLLCLLAGERNETITTASYGPHWRALRCNLTADVLHPSRLASLAPMQREATRALLADVSARAQLGEVAVRGPVNAAVFGLVARLCFGDGVEGPHVRAMERVMQELVLTVGEISAVFDGTWLARLVYRRQLRRLVGFIGRQTELYLPLIEARRKHKSRSFRSGDDIFHSYVDSLLGLGIPSDAADDVRRALRDDELVVLVSEFLGTGTGSVVACVEWALAHLIDQPEVQSKPYKLRREIDGEAVLSSKSLRGMPYLHAVVLECLRMHPPVPFALRGAHGEGAKVVPSAQSPVPANGLRVQFNLGDIGRDRKAWTDPDEFRPERFLAGGEAEGIGPSPGLKEIRMMPFGAAHRHCPGMSMGMLHIKCFLAAMVREFEWAPSAEDRGRGGIDMMELDGLFKVMKRPLSACVTPRI
ncbi:cytochrome P450 89A2-like [Triticum dicoccoides]|uniref:cytochrome P450 89A2-like n=1 Tax=Triticum dicoccoides TaxID=85692 RepID=UPI00188E9285|nr:cytochrome P450 89A2-like [Triticum dicoccoides]